MSLAPLNPVLHRERLSDLGLFPQAQCLRQSEENVRSVSKRLGIQYESQEDACQRIQAAVETQQNPVSLESLPSEFTEATDDQQFDAEACFSGVYTKPQMRLLVEHLHRRGLVMRARLEELDAEDSLRGTCALLARFFSPSSAMDVQQTFAALDCQYFSGVPDQDLLALAEWLQRDGLIDKQINLSRLTGAKLCEIIVQTYAEQSDDQPFTEQQEQPAITADSSYAARRLDSLLTVAEPIIPDIPFLQTARQELAAYRALWPEPRSLDRDVRAMCREFFQRKVKRVPQKEHRDRIALLTALANIFYDERDLQRAIEGGAPSTAVQQASATSASASRPTTEKQAQDALKSAEVEAAQKVHEVIMSRYGQRVVRGTEGQELLETVRLCLLLSHPVIRRTMERVGKVSHLTDDVVARLRKEEQRVAKEYAEEQKAATSEQISKPKKEETLSEWMWRKASEAVAALGTLPSWNTRKAFLLQALFLSSALMPQAGATIVDEETAVLLGQLSDARIAEVRRAMRQTAGGIGGGVTFQPSVGVQRQETERAETRLSPELRITVRGDVQRAGEHDPRPAGRVGFPLPKDMSLEEFRDKVRAVIDYQAIMDSDFDVDDQARQIKQNLCSFMFNGLLVPSTGDCKLTRDATLFNLPDIPEPEKTESYRALIEFFGDWFKSEMFESKAGARVQVVTPSGLPLEFLLDAERNYAAAKVLGVLTPTLFALGTPRDTTFSVMPGGEILLPKNERARNQITFYPTEKGKSYDVLRDVEWATRLCTDMMKTTREAEDAVKVLLLAPEQGESEQAFEAREKVISALLDRCAADIADTAGFLALCPIDGSEMPLECKLQLERLEQRLLADFKSAEQRTSEHMRYERFVDQAMNEQNAVTLLPPTLYAELWGTSQNSQVREWLQRRWKEDFNLVVSGLPDGLSKEERARREDLFLRLVEAIGLKAHWFDRLVNFFSNMSAVSATASLVAATLVAVYLRYGRQERGQWQEGRGRGERRRREDEDVGDVRTPSRGKSPGRRVPSAAARRRQQTDVDEEDEEDEDYLQNLLTLFRGTLPSRSYKSALRNWALFRQLQTPERSTDWDDYLSRSNYAVVTDWLVKRYPREAASFVRGDHKRFL